MLEKIIEISLVFYDKVAKIYLPSYFSWLNEKLSGTEPFAILLISIVVFLGLVVYIWHRNQSS